MRLSSAGRLLLVENVPRRVAQVARLMDEFLPDCTLTTVESLDEAHAALAGGGYAAVLAGAALLDGLLTHDSGTPVICLVDGETDRLAFLHRGAFDCAVAGAGAAADLVRATTHALALQAARRDAHHNELRVAASRGLGPSGHFELAADLTPVFVSRQCQELCGVRENDPASFERTLTEAHPDDLGAIHSAIEGLRAGRDIHMDYRRVCPDGSVMVLDVRGARVLDDDGELLGYVGRVCDITEERSIALRERASRTQLEAIFDHSPSIMWFKDLESRYMFVNAVFAEFFDRDPMGFHGLSDAELFGAEVGAGSRERDVAVLAAGGPQEFEDMLDTFKGRRLFSTVVFPIFDADGTASGLCGLSTDITERRQTDELFRRSFDDAPVAMNIVRPGGTLLRVNRAMGELLGYEPSEMLDRSFADFTHPDDVDGDFTRAQGMVDGTIEGSAREKRFIRRDGSVVWTLSNVDLARDDHGRPLWFVSHVLDITHRKQTEHELQRQQMDMLAIARVARDSGSSDTAGQQVCEAAAEITGASSVSLLELRGAGRLVLAASMDKDAPVGLELHVGTPPTGAGLCAVSKERLFLSDARHNPAMSQRLAAAGGVRSVVFEPIMRGSDVLGVLTIAWSEPHPTLTPRENSVIRLLAAELATIIERARLTAQLRELARTDPLTGLANRRVWDERIVVELNHARRLGHSVCVALLDLDHFKRYNDTQGHQAGDRLLNSATAAWAGELRSADLLARVGGDEFAVLLPDCDLAGGTALIERLRVSTPEDVGCSVGIVEWDGEEPADVAIARADAALYAAKESGRARSVAG